MKKLAHEIIAKELDPIAPKWAHKFHTLGDQDMYTIRVQLGDPQYCIAGEAWNFTDSYIKECEKCNLYGNRMFDRFLYCYDDSTETFKDDPYYIEHLKREIVQFKKHLKAKHKRENLK